MGGAAVSVRDLSAFRADLARARGGGAFSPAEREAAARIVAAVRRRGDLAVLASVRRFDRAEARAGDLMVDAAALRRAARRCPLEVRRALDLAHARLLAFHARQRPSAVRRRDGHAAIDLVPAPLARVGGLVPRGVRAYPSTALMIGVPARIAGVDELVLASPMGRDGTVDPALAYAATLVGARLLYRAGGAAAVAALAYGTASLTRVDKVVGPGNAYATAAKWLVSADVGIDALQGPSELVAVASGDADATLLALDLLAQAEHGAGAFAALLSDDPALLARVSREVRRRGGAHVVCYRAPTLAAAASAADEVAPEHALVAGRAALRHAGAIRRAGALYVGARSAVAFGDYVAGANHCLPTGGTARWSSPLRVEDFVRWRTTVSLFGELGGLAARAAVLARWESMPYHAASVEARA